MMLDSKIPAGKLEEKWNDYKGHCKLVNPANKRKLEVIVVGTGLAGASASIAKILFGLFVIGFLIFLALGVFVGKKVSGG